MWKPEMHLPAPPAAGAQARDRAVPTTVTQQPHTASACKLAANVLKEVPRGIHSGSSGHRDIGLPGTTMPEA